MEQGVFDFEAGETLLFDKELDWTSFDVVKKVRNLIKVKKVGHAGTLDPLATGLLILCTGKHTKRIEGIQNAPKVYTGELILGATTPSFDLETEVNQQYNIDDINETQIMETAQSFIGAYEQTPPIYSAVKVDGKRAYEHARKGNQVELKTRIVQITTLQITSIELPKVNFEVHCSKGTYIRSLASDFGKRLNNGAYLSKLRRTAIGDYKVEKALTIKEFEQVIGKY